jgi:aconitate hydratase
MQIEEARLNHGRQSYRYPSLERYCGGEREVKRLPFVVRILLENALRGFDGSLIRREHCENLRDWQNRQGRAETAFMPSRILMQDFTGVPAVVDIASLGAEADRRGVDPQTVYPRIPVDCIIDHSVQVDRYGTEQCLQQNIELEYARNAERYRLLKWADQAFDRLSVLAPGMGICHQVNLESLATVVSLAGDQVFPDTLVGTDSHTPMIDGIGVLGWGVGGIEAEAAMLGMPLYFPLPEVIGVRFTGRLGEGVTATDLVLHLTHLLRKRGVVGAFLEFGGPGLDTLKVPDRATIANMSPEFGCTAAYFPPDQKTLEYLQLTGRSSEQVQLTERYTRANALWREDEELIRYSDILELDLATVEPALAGPSRPQDHIPLAGAAGEVRRQLAEEESSLRNTETEESRGKGQTRKSGPESTGWEYGAGLPPAAVAIAAITSCTNTSNPEVMLAAGLLARNAVKRGLRTQPWVKTSLAPGSKIVTDYLQRAGLLPYLEALGFHLVGYGCTTCIGNSGDLAPAVREQLEHREAVLASILSGNRNFEARIHPRIALNYLASPPLVVAYALAGTMTRDLNGEPVGWDPNGEAVYLHELWPRDEELEELASSLVEPEIFRSVYATLHQGDRQWQNLETPGGKRFNWDRNSDYIREAPFFIDLPNQPGSPQAIEGARALLVLGHSVTTDHISPASRFAPDSPAGAYLLQRGVGEEEFNTYGARRGNHEVMARGTFANVRLRNELAGRRGGFTTLLPDDREMTVWEAACEYQRREVPLIIIAGSEYGSGSSRDWAAKGTLLLGVRAVIAESFERIHRSNLACMGVLPLQFADGESRESLGLSGKELFSIPAIGQSGASGQRLTVKAVNDDGREKEFAVTVRLDTEIEAEYYRHGGVLQYVLRRRLEEEGCGDTKGA